MLISNNIDLNDSIEFRCCGTHGTGPYLVLDHIIIIVVVVDIDLLFQLCY